MSTEVEEALAAVRAREQALQEYIEHKGWCQYRLHDYSDEWPCTCGLADVWDGSGEPGVVTQYALLADHLGERIKELREALEACEAREAVYRNQCLHHTLCGWRVGEACDCWLSEVQQDGAALDACIAKHTARLRQALRVAREIIETVTAEHDEDRPSVPEPGHGDGTAARVL